MEHGSRNFRPRASRVDAQGRAHSKYPADDRAEIHPLENCANSPLITVQLQREPTPANEHHHREHAPRPRFKCAMTRRKPTVRRTSGTKLVRAPCMRFGTSRRDPRARTRERELGSPPPSPSLNFKATRSYIRITQCFTLLRTQGRRFISIHSRSVNCERRALTANYAANSLRAPPLRLPRHSALSWIDERRCGICANACDGTFSNAMRGQLHRRPGTDDERASLATPRQRPALVPKPFLHLAL